MVFWQKVLFIILGVFIGNSGFSTNVLCEEAVEKNYVEVTEKKTEVIDSDSLALWEYGVVALAASLPHYRGSDENKAYAFPLPYFVYRGEKIKASREGIRGIFFKSEKFETDLSISGNPPVNDDNKAREGMDELGAMVEIGPALRYYFYKEGTRDSLFIQANLRAAFSIDFDDDYSSDHEGYVTDLSLVYRDSQTLKSYKLRFHLSGGVQFGDAGFHSFFYDVVKEDVTPERSSYSSDGGYGGFMLSGSIVREITPSLFVSCYSRWINLSGAVYEDSPLVKTENNFVVGAMLAWKIGESDVKVK